MMFPQLYNDLSLASNPEKKVAMEKYMKNNFPFIGVQNPIRTAIQKPYLQALKSEKNIDWKIVFELWNYKEREMHYVAMDYLIAKKKHLTANDFDNILKLLTSHQWWDSIDTITSHIIGYMFYQFPETKAILKKWNATDDMWLKRTTIISQLKGKEKTDTAFLTYAITSNLNSKEFFINKAIGWSLREYAKKNPEWVRQFISNHTLASLSKKEASKYL